MYEIFINSKNSNSSDSLKLLLSLTNKYTFREVINMLVDQALVILYMEKYRKSHTKIINLKYQLQHGFKSLYYLMDHILCQIFKTALNISLKNMEKRLLILQ